MTTGRFELRQDEDTGRRYWFGSEDGWKDATEVGEDGMLTMHADAFEIGAVLHFSEPDDLTGHEIATADANLAELARLRSELSGVRDVLAQRDRAIVAERRAREIAQADSAALQAPIERLYQWHAVSTTRDYGLHGPECGICNVVRMYRESHPGAARGELEAARAVVAAMRNPLNPPHIERLFAAYDAAVKARE